MQRLFKRLLTDKSIHRFLAVGIISFIIDYGLLLILHDVFSVQINVATSAAFLVSLIANFMLNKLWTFNAPRGAKQSSKQAVQYALLVVVNLLITNLVVGGAASMGIGPEWSKPVAVGLTMTLNYVVYQRVIFKGKPPTEEPFAG